MMIHLHLVSGKMKNPSTTTTDDQVQQMRQRISRSTPLIEQKMGNQVRNIGFMEEIKSFGRSFIGMSSIGIPLCQEKIQKQTI